MKTIKEVIEMAKERAEEAYQQEKQFEPEVSRDYTDSRTAMSMLSDAQELANMGEKTMANELTNAAKFLMNSIADRNNPRKR